MRLPATNNYIFIFVSSVPGSSNINTNSRQGTEIVSSYTLGWASQAAHWVQTLPPAMQEMLETQGLNPWVGNMPWRRKWHPTPVFLPGWMPRTEEPGGLQPMGSQRVPHDKRLNTAQNTTFSWLTWNHQYSNVLIYKNMFLWLNLIQPVTLPAALYCNLYPHPLGRKLMFTETFTQGHTIGDLEWGLGIHSSPRQVLLQEAPLYAQDIRMYKESKFVQSVT